MARAPAALEIEPLPEADRLEGYPHPRATRRLFGQEAAERTLAEALAGGRMHHGWIVSGPSGIGKATLAYRFARAALARRAEHLRPGATLEVGDDTSAARQVRALSHPDLLVIRRVYNIKDKRFGATIPVDEVRRLRSFLALAAGPDIWRVVIVDTADEMNPSAANAILKSLEEPPARTVFLLISSEPGGMLPTIRSRCRMLTLEKLSDQDLLQAVAQASAAADEPASPAGEAEQRRLLRLAGGSVRRYLGLMSDDGLAVAEQVTKLVSDLPKVDWASVHTLADDITPAAAIQRFELFYELLLDHLARLIRAAATGSGDETEAALARRLMADGRLATFAALWENLVRDKADALALNLDRKSLILQTVAGLQTASR